MSAIVVGGGIAGLLAARVLSEKYDRVTILERDVKGAPGHARAGTPQANHLHVLLQRGRQILESWFPGIDEELARRGCPEIDWGQDTAWLNPYGWAPRFPSQVLTRSASRIVLEEAIRRRVLEIPNVTFVGAASVEELGFDSARAAVTGAWSRSSGVRRFLPAELVAIAHGNQNALVTWLGSFPMEKVEAPVRYASRRYRLPASALEGKQLYIQISPREQRRGGVVCPVEDGEYLVTVLSAEPAAGPRDDDEFVDFAKSLRSPRLYEVLRRGHPVGPIHRYHRSQSSWLRLPHGPWPSGVIALGDVVCTLNPVYGQGMTVTALEIEELAQRANSGGGWESGYQKSVDAILRLPWEMACSQDLALATASPRVSWRRRGTQAFLRHVLKRSVHARHVHESFLEVLHMVKRPGSLVPPLLRRAP